MSPRNPLRPDSILEAALRIVDDGGLPALTIRRLASSLGVSPMAIYRHFADKDAILDGLLEVVIARHLPPTEPPAERALQDTFLGIRAALVAHPAVIRLLGASGSYGPGSLRVAEEILAALSRRGHPPAQAGALFHALVSYTIGSAVLHAASVADRGDPDALRRRRAQVESLSIRDHPRVVEHAAALASFASDGQFLAGLDAILGHVDAPTPIEPRGTARSR